MDLAVSVIIPCTALTSGSLDALEARFANTAQRIEILLIGESADTPETLHTTESSVSYKHITTEHPYSLGTIIAAIEAASAPFLFFAETEGHIPGTHQLLQYAQQMHAENLAMLSWVPNVPTSNSTYTGQKAFAHGVAAGMPRQWLSSSLWRKELCLHVTAPLKCMEVVELTSSLPLLSLLLFHADTCKSIISTQSGQQASPSPVTLQESAANIHLYSAMQHSILPYLATNGCPMHSLDAYSQYVQEQLFMSTCKFHSLYSQNPASAADVLENTLTKTRGQRFLKAFLEGHPAMQTARLLRDNKELRSRIWIQRAKKFPLLIKSLLGLRRMFLGK